MDYKSSLRKQHLAGSWNVLQMLPVCNFPSFFCLQCDVPFRLTWTHEVLGTTFLLSHGIEGCDFQPELQQWFLLKDKKYDIMASVEA